MSKINDDNDKGEDEELFNEDFPDRIADIGT